MSANTMDAAALGGLAHPNPAFDYLTSFVPRKLRDLLKWAEFLVYNSAHVYALVRKFGELPITRFVFGTPSPMSRDKHKALFEQDLRAKGFLTEASFDRHVYGNAFASVLEPFVRYLQCAKCNTREGIDSADWTYNADAVEFRHLCRVCNRRGVARCIDEPLLVASKIKLQRWDPKLMDINFNPITGDREYYYEIPRDTVEQVRAGNRMIVSTMPMAFLETIKARKAFKFAPDSIYHMRAPGPAGTESAWGFPPLTSALKLFLFAAILRRANEAIALEHITPFRVVHPMQNIASADPHAGTDLAVWRGQLTNEYKLWRRDPLRMQISPIPIGVQNIGGDGRALLTIAELQEAEKAIVISMGVPLEFLTGGLGQTRGEITLRMVENQLQTHIEDLNGLTNWIEKKVSRFMGWPSVPTRLADFKLIDDVENKGIYMQMWQAGKLSDTKIGEVLGIDWQQERKQVNEDRLAALRAELEFQAQQSKLQNSLKQQALSQASLNQGGGNYNPAQIMEKATEIAEEYKQYDEGTIRSRLDALKGEDSVMYACVRMQLDQMSLNEQQTAKAQARAGG